MVDPDKNNGVVKPLDQEMGNGGGGGLLNTKNSLIVWNCFKS